MLNKFLQIKPTSWSPFSCLFTHSYTFPLLQLPAEITGTYLLWGILGRLPYDGKTFFQEKPKQYFDSSINPPSE